MAGELAIEAFKKQKAKKEGNTESTGTDLVLFGNIIAQWRNGVDIYIRNAGWFTKTTKDRLNKLGARLQQVKGEWHLNGSNWKGEWIKIDEVPKQNIEREAKSSLFS